jgi:hypothetical protein
LTGLVKKLDQRLQAMTATPQRAPGVFVIFDNNVNGLDGRLREMAEKEALKRVSLCIGPPPGDYEVNWDADVTVVVYNVARRGQQKVTANFALRTSELNEAKVNAIVKSVGDMLPK